MSPQPEVPAGGVYTGSRDQPDWYDCGDQDVGDLREELLEKERNLVLAAQFGKSLLERNQELVERSQADKEEYENIVDVSVFSLFDDKIMPWN